MTFFPEVVLLLIITFVMSLLGSHLGGEQIKNLFSKKLELVAGIVLIIMGIRLIMI